MLTLTRLEGESIVIPRYGIRITVASIFRDKVRIGIEAPDDVAVWRSEIAPKPAAVTSTRPAIRPNRNTSGK